MRLATVRRQMFLPEPWSSSSGAGWTRRPYFARSVRQDRASRSDRFGEARALELRHPPVGIGAEFGREGLHGLECALDRGAVRDGLRGKEAHPRQLDVAGAESPALPPLDGLARFGEERAGSGAIAGGPLRVRERRQDARLVPQCGAPRARERERGLQRARGGGDVAGGELGGARKRGGPRPGGTAAAPLPPPRRAGGRGARARASAPPARRPPQRTPASPP